MLDLIFGIGIDVGLVAFDRVPWSDHIALKAHLGSPVSSFVGRELTYASLWRQMDPIGFQNALESDAPNDFLGELIDDWLSHLSEAIDKIAPQYPLPLIQISTMVYHETLKDEMRAKTTRISLSLDS